MAVYREHRNMEASLIDYIKENLELSGWTNINIVKTFNQAYREDLPVICIRVPDENSRRLEIGSNRLLRSFSIYIDIFANDDGFKLDFTDWLVDLLKDGCPYYEYTTTRDNNENEVITSENKVRNGWIEISRFTANRNIELGIDADKYDKHRRFIAILVYIQKEEKT